MSRFVIFTARVRSTREGTVFTGVCLSTSGGGTYLPGGWGGDTYSALDGGGGTYLPRSGQGVPSTWEGRYPLPGKVGTPRLGYPPPHLGR